MMFIATIIIILFINYLSIRFWIWLFKEVFKRNVNIKDLLVYGISSVLAAIGSIRIFNISGIISKSIIEETSKIGTSELQNHSVSSDHIISAVLSGISFAIIENCIYLFYLNENILAISLMRVVCGSILHGLFTGIIGFGIYCYLINNKSSSSLVVLGFSLLAGLGFHASYNRLLSESYVAFAMIFVIIGYFGLSFLIYKSDSLYFDTKTY